MISGSTAIADVEVALNPSDAGPVACNASNGIVGIAVLPDRGRGAAAAPAGAAAAPTGSAGSAATPAGSAGSAAAPASASASPGTRAG